MWIDDQILNACHKQLVYQSWVPSELMVVLGRSNQAEQEAEVERCEKDGVPILKRYGGGGTVLLHPGCLVVSVGAWVDSPYQNDLYFRLLNDAIILSIQDQLPVDLGQRGYSDIVFGERKIAGTSLFRSRQYLLYQASLLIHDRMEEIETYLKHPTKEPDYRKARTHRDFLSCLEQIQRQEGSSQILSADDWARHFEKVFFAHLHQKLSGHLQEPMGSHIPHLLKRIEQIEVM